MVDNTEVNWVENYIVRGVLGRALDLLVYWLLGLVYQIFFNVASAELFTNETVKNFYGRVQLILGVFMIFKIAVSIIKGIVNPDSFTDKGKGMGNIVTRIIFTLVMLTIIVPINIPNAQTEYEIQLNNNGLLFGTLYSLQNRILSNNTIGRLVLGTTDGMSIRGDSADLTDTNKKLKEAANVFTSAILKGFIRINIIDEEKEETDSSNWVCKDTLDQDILDVYTDLAANPSEMIALTTLKCDAPGSGVFAKLFNTNERYAFAYKYLISAIVGIVFIFIMVSFTVDVAVRAIKLAILRLVAPIPIISYMDPAGESKFKKWTSVLTATYVDLFIRLAVIYFVIFLIQDIIVHGLVVNQAKGVVGVFTYIFIFIGLFVFAKKAPKFFKDLFDMKGEFSLFGGLGEMLGVAAVGASAVGSAVTGYKATKASREEQGKGNNFFANMGGALAHGISGTKSAWGAYGKAEKNQWKAVTDDSIARNNAHMNQAYQGVSAGGKWDSRMRSVFGGDTPAQKDERKKNAMKTYEGLYKHVAGKADVDGMWKSASTDPNIHGKSVKELKEDYERTKLSGTATAADIKAAEDRYKSAQEEYINDVISDVRAKRTTGGAYATKAGGTKGDGRQFEAVYADIEEADKIGKSYSGDLPQFGNAKDFKGNHFTAGDIAYTIEHDNQHQINKANDAAAGVGGKK